MEKTLQKFGGDFLERSLILGVILQDRLEKLVPPQTFSVILVVSLHELRRQHPSVLASEQTLLWLLQQYHRRLWQLHRLQSILQLKHIQA